MCAEKKHGRPRVGNRVKDLRLRLGLTVWFRFRFRCIGLGLWGSFCLASARAKRFEHVGWGLGLRRLRGIQRSLCARAYS